MGPLGALVIVAGLTSVPKTLSLCVTMVSTKFDVVNLAGTLSLGVLLPVLRSSSTPFTSKFGLGFDLLFDVDALALEFELRLFPLVPAGFVGVSDSFSAEESDDPLSAGIGLYGGIVFTLLLFF